MKRALRKYLPYITATLALLGLSLCLGAALAVDSGPTVVYAGMPAADKPLRLHILANSDSAVDQGVKLALRDSVAGYLENELSGCTDKQQAMDQLQAALPLIEQLCNTSLRQLGASYDARAYIETADFPSIDYDGLVFAAGEYDALRIVLGSGQGHNWWCVLFPPLCFVDLAAEVDETAMVAAMTGSGQTTASGDSYRVSWKLGEWLKP